MTIPLERKLLQQQDRSQLRYNFVVNVLDGGFFGFGIGVASFVTVIPLFVATLTDSTVLIGLIASIHMLGWQVPQLFTAKRVARLRRYKPMVILLTLHERWPFFGLAFVSLALPVLGRELALVLTFLFLIIQGFGGGFTATPWQTMIAKIMPANFRGTFYGAQSAFANLFSSGGAILAGFLLATLGTATGFTACFLIAGVAMGASLVFLMRTREAPSPAVPEVAQERGDYRKKLIRILRQDHNFRWFVAARMLAQLANVGLAFFTIYAVRRYNMPDQMAGVMTGVLMLAQTFANPVLGWLGDRRSHRIMFAAGALMAMTGSVLAIFAPNLNWFYAVFALSGAAQAALWTTTMTMASSFGTAANRPYYIGLSNTLVAPVTLLAPIVGGWLADSVGFEATFLMGAVSALAAAAVLVFGLREPVQAAEPVPEVAALSKV
jgi:MFS family permease